MDTKDAKTLIEKAFLSTEKELWADLGCGAGFFTKALSELIQPGSKIFAVDTDTDQFDPNITDQKVTVELIKSSLIDYTPSSKLDGVLMANVLHYIEDKADCLHSIFQWLKPAGKIIIIEYQTTKSNSWVPYPILKQNLEVLLKQVGFGPVTLIGEYPSKYHGSMYALTASRTEK